MMKQALLFKGLIRSVSINFVYSTSNYATFTNKRVLREPTPPKYEPFVHRFDHEIQDFIAKNQDLSSLPDFKLNVIQKYNTRLLSEQSFDAVFMRLCLASRNYQMGKAYLNYITQSGKQANIATLSKFLTLCYFCSNEVDDKDEVEKLCSHALSQNEFIDASTKESIIAALTITNNWKYGLKLLKEDEGTHHSVPLNAIIDCLLHHDEFDEALFWMERMIIKERTISDFIYDHWLKKCHFNQHVWNMFLNFLIRNRVFLKRPFVEQIKSQLESHPSEPSVGQFTTVNESTGTCLSCRKVLKNASITDEDFAALKKALMDKVLCGKDIFLGSKPEELESYQALIKKTAPYDIVIDGLNVAYHTSTKAHKLPPKKHELLQSVVDHFARQNLKILVLTRKHLIREPYLSKVKRHAVIFATENMSNDDPFLLYAAVQSKHTKFVSDDLFRDHLFRLADNRLEMVFRIWQHSAQIQIVRFNNDRTVVFHYPRTYQTVTQMVDGHWHIPYDDGTPRFNYQVPKTWLCLKPKPVTRTDMNRTIV